MRKKKRLFGPILVLILMWGAACSNNPQLPSVDYKPQLVLFGILAPGTYTLSETAFIKPLRYNFFVVQRTFKQRERLLLLPMNNVSIWVDSVQMEKVGELKQNTYSANGGSFAMKTPIYSFDQKTFPIQANKTYTVRASAPRYLPISASTVVPEKPVILEPADSTVSFSQKTIRLKWGKTKGAAGYHVMVWCGKEKLRWPCDEGWLNAARNTYVINLEDYYFPNSLDTLEVAVQALDQNYVNYLSLRDNFFSTCLTQSSFQVKNGLGVLGSLNETRRRFFIVK